MAGSGFGAAEVGHASLVIARDAVEGWVRTGLLSEPPRALPPALRERSGAFVSLRAGPRLRGCIGTLAPTRVTLAHEIIACAVNAATRDPRFPPVRLDELPGLVYEVDIVGALEAVAGIGDLDPKLYGVVVESAGRRGVLLPDLQGVDTPEQQVQIARMKAGLPPDAPLGLYRFGVWRFAEPGSPA